ncbi:glycosyltransferase family 39 protein [Candidatus Micrarchaeota archaeon]|nr:glycosyltransferase family 39 protein [Candidatus Micrarchaeota archaeon]
MPQKDSSLVLLLLVIYTLTRIPLLFYLSLVKDEGLYSIMIMEQSRNLTMIPTFLGEAVNWKPALFFWVYSLFPHLPDLFPIEASFRYPSLIFGLLSVPLVFQILRNAGAGRNIAFFSSLIFILSLPSIYPNGALLVDSLNFFLISLSLCLYTLPAGSMGRWRYLAAGVLVFAAFFVKLVICFMVPILAVAFFFFGERKKLKDPVFLLSLLAAPLALLANALLLQGQGAGSDLSVSVLGEHPAFHDVGRQLASMVGSMDILLLGAGIWFALSLMGALRHWRENRFMALWYALILFPIFTGYFMVWYYLPVMPAVAFFSAMILLRWEGADKIDLFFWLFFGVAVALTIGMCGYFYFTMHDGYAHERDAGLFLAGKANVLIIGYYPPGMVAYKVLTEIKTQGKADDFGWIIIDPADYPPGTADRYVQNYSMDAFPVSGSFSTLFKSNLTFRKNTNLTRFDYVVASYIPLDMPDNASVIYNESNITIYRMG